MFTPIITFHFSSSFLSEYYPNNPAHLRLECLFYLSFLGFTVFIQLSPDLVKLYLGQHRGAPLSVGFGSYALVSIWSECVFHNSFSNQRITLIAEKELNSIIVFRIEFENFQYWVNIYLPQIFTNLKRNSCPIVKIIAPSCSGRHYAHLEYPPTTS